VAAAAPSTDRVQRGVYAVSIAVSVLVAVLILAPRPAGLAGALDVSALPWVNAGINTLTAAILVAGFAAIRAKRIALHRRLMTTALGTSSAFLASYVVYHTFSPGPARYEGDWRGVYLFVLLTHVVLAALILPAALTTWLRGWTGRVADHRRIAPATLAVWLYVSVTGVLVTWMAHG
jgi:putative membrane protein